MAHPERVSAIIPSYSLGGVNEPVELYSGRGSLRGLRGEVTVQLRCKPALRTVAELTPDDEMSSFDQLRSWMQDDDSRLELDGLNKSVPILPSSPTRGLIHGSIELESVDAALDRVVFLVVNLADLMGHGDGFVVVDDADGQHLGQGRMILASGPWVIELDSRVGLRAVLEALAEEGGYAVTHVGRLRRADGATFAPADAEHLLSGLHALLSFGWGAWVTPIAPVGYDSADAVVWRQWGTPLSADWRKPLAWLDEHHAEGLVEIADAFFARWADPCWRQVLQRAVGTYVEANSSGGHRPAMLDTRLLLAGTGLELLAWAILDGGCDDPNATESGDAAHKRIRRLLRRAGIDPALPEQLTALCELARTEGWQDGPQAVTKARNWIAHPRRRSGTAEAVTVLQQRPMFEAWRLMIECFELVLLHELGYRGSYARHLNLPRWVGKIEPVPWTRHGPDHEA